MTIFIYYVSEHQSPHAVNKFHTTLTTHVNWGPMLLKLIGWRHCPCFRWISCIPETMTQMPDAELDRTARYCNNSIK